MACCAAPPATSMCEWKGAAKYWDVVVGDDVLPRVGWSYPNPTPDFAILADFVAFYAAPFDALLRGWRKRHSAAGRILRRVDHQQGGRAVQGYSGQPVLVVPGRVSLGNSATYC